MQRIIKLAEAIAREYDQEYVGTEHVLLAIAREGASPGAKLLKSLRLSDARIRKEVDRLIVKSMEDTWVFGRLPGSPHYRNVISKAIEEARRLGSSEIGTEHVLLALMREKGSVAHNALKVLGVSFEDLRARIEAAQDEKKGAEKGPLKGE